jgi:SLOG in TRPM, prokaryote
MRTHNIYFSKQQTLCVFPDERSDLAEAISELGLEDNHPVIVLIGGDIDKREALPTRQAIITISKIAENLNAVVVCGGTDMGVMAEIGQMRWRKSYHYPLVGVAPEALVTWPGGPRSTKFLWWGKKRWHLEPHYSHFVLVPGSKHPVQREAVCNDLDQRRRSFPERYRVEFGERSSGDRFESYGTSGR